MFVLFLAGISACNRKGHRVLEVNYVSAPQAALRDAHWPGALGTSPIVNLHVVYDRPVLEQRFAAGVDTPVQYLFDRTPQGWRDGQP